MNFPNQETVLDEDYEQLHVAFGSPKRVLVSKLRMYSPTSNLLLKSVTVRNGRITLLGIIRRFGIAVEPMFSTEIEHKPITAPKFFRHFQVR